MSNLSASACAHPNIAFIKYWGNRDEALRLPANASLSMNLAGLETVTQVTFAPDLPTDEVNINGQLQSGPAAARVSAFLDLVRAQAKLTLRARVESRSNFPAGAGIASSAAAFAALSLAGAAAAGLALSERELSALARRGSGSAARSVPGGFVEWRLGATAADSFAFSIAPPSHWDLRDVVAVVSQTHKAVGSTGGHALAPTSPLQAARLADAPRRLASCRAALLERDFERFAASIELDSDVMHAVMMTSQPALFYWKPATLAVMEAIRAWRADGLPVAYTIDAGPNVHCICQAAAAPEVKQRLSQLAGIERVFSATPGGPARLVSLAISSGV